jgi:hypothetical protein
MKLSIGQLRRIIKEELIVAEKEVFLRKSLHEGTIRVKDLKDALELLGKHKTREKAWAAAKSAGKTGLKALIGLLPLGGAVTAAIEGGDAVKDMYDAAKDVDPKEKKKNPLWDLMTIDPDTSAIVDDAVEGEFIKALQARVAQLSDNDVIPDADELLRRYLTNKYRGAHVTK